MLSYTTGRNRFGDLTNNSSAANLTLGDSLINAEIKTILGKRNWPFLEYQDSTLTTTAGTQFYTLRFNTRKVMSAQVQNGNISYTPREAPSREFWDKLNISSGTQSNVPQWFYVYYAGNGIPQLGFYPIPSTSSLSIIYTYKFFFRDLSIADYIVGTVTTTTSGGTTVVGSGTTWTSAMAKRWIRIDESSSGDGEWYQIASVTNATTLVLATKYGGTSIAAGSSTYTIAQVSPLPDPYDWLPVYRAVATYYMKNEDDGRAKEFTEKANDLYTDMVREFGEKTSNPVISPNDIETLNPNLTITL